MRELVLAAAACLAAAFDAFVAALGRFGLALLAAIEAMAAPSTFALSGEGGPISSRPGLPLDAALQNSLRHEANVSRRSAARHT
jgi:hypothetical protein